MTSPLPIFLTHTMLTDVTCSELHANRTSTVSEQLQNDWEDGCGGSGGLRHPTTQTENQWGTRQLNGKLNFTADIPARREVKNVVCGVRRLKPRSASLTARSSKESNLCFLRTRIQLYISLKWSEQGVFSADSIADPYSLVV